MGVARKLLALVVPLLLLGLPAAAEAVPRTGFEQTGQWTTFDEEQAFLHKLSRRVNVTRIGSTVQGRPLQLVRLGGGPTVLLFLCSQHGDEPAGREACLIKLRDLAYSHVPAGVTVLFVPAANPDGRQADTRGNADGVDINRDHIALETPEGKAIAAVIRDYRPDVVHDLHEFGPTPLYYDKDVLWLWPRNLNVSSRVHDESEILSKSYIRPAVEAGGHTSGVYGIWTDPVTGEPIKQIAGDGQERILRNTAGLKHSLGLLVETNVSRTPQQRVQSHLAGVAATFRLVAERRIQIETATTLSRFQHSGPIYFDGADNQAPAKVVDPPRGYTLTAEQYAQVKDKLTLHGVWSVPAHGGRFVPLAQQARPLIPLLLDARADFHLVSGTPSW
jgi:Zinc carboxypeptidase